MDREIVATAIRRIPRLGPRRIMTLMETEPDLERLWNLGPEGLSIAAGGEGIFHYNASALLRDAESEVDAAHRLGARIVTISDAEYPRSLRAVFDPPVVLYIMGEIAEIDAGAVAIVGARRSTPYGESRARELSRDLAVAGLTIVSGLARGIDSTAHAAALDAGGRTIAVLGTGIDILYPNESAELGRRIAASGAGALVSEFPPGTPPIASNFPQRNRIIAGLSRAVVVVEASERSGSLITARDALEYGREVLAVPGPVGPSSRGTHKLIRDGAEIAETADDVLRAIRAPRASGEHPPDREPSSLPPALPPGVGPEGYAILRVLGAGEKQIDAIFDEIDAPAPVVSASLMRLEIAGFIRQRPGKLFSAL